MTRPAPRPGEAPARSSRRGGLTLSLAVVGAALLVVGLAAPPAWAACGSTASSRLPATGAGVVLPLAGLVLLGVAWAIRRRRRTGSALLLTVALLAGSCVALGTAARPASAQECAGPGGTSTSPAPPNSAGSPSTASPAAPAGAAGSSAAPAASSTPAEPATYLVGAAVESINPTRAMLDSGEFYLGGYGLSNGKVAGTLSYADGRKATGILRDGVHSRALAVSDGSRALVTAQIETQGVFAAYKIGPYGIEDIRRDAAAAAKAARPGGPELGPGQILVDSNHTHVGPDTAGVWGGVPTSYLKLVHDRTVAAIVRAYASMVPATLSYGTAKGGVKGQGRERADRQPVRRRPGQPERRRRAAGAASQGPRRQGDRHLPQLLGAPDGAGRRQHPGQPRLHRSAVKPARQLRRGRLRAGRHARPHPACPAGCPDTSSKGAAASACALDEYAGRVFVRARQAVAAATPLTGKAVVELHSYLIQDVTTNAPIFALANGGFAFGAPILRQTTPPWFTGNAIGTTTFSGRIGDVLISGSPGEPYPQIALAVVKATPTLRGHLSLGTSGDFLGYLVAPFPEAYPEPIRRSVLSGDAPPAGADCSGVPSPVGCPSPLNNDNYFFNSSMTIGERITCSLLRGADDVLGQASRRSARASCGLFANDLAMAADADTTFATGPYRPIG